MRHPLISVLLCLLLFGTAQAEPGDVSPAGEFIPAVDGPGVRITSNSSGLAARETTGPDTFVLYGGPDHPTEGKFQLSNEVTPDWGAGHGLPYTGAPGEWQPVDNTDLPVFWHRSTFNAEDLGPSMPLVNFAMWCGVSAGDPIGDNWEYLPGYGNSWNVSLLYESAPVSDPSVGEVVDLEFYFHHDTEPNFDYFNVQYDSAGIWTSVLAADGSNKDSSNVFHAPGVQFSTVQTKPIMYAGNDFGGDNSDQIRIRLQVTSDGAWSDQDGLWPTTAGAVQLDEITMTTSQGVFTEDYQAGQTPPDKYLFHPDKAPFAGDFAEVYPRLTDIDPCRDNLTPVIGFIDYGQTIRSGPGLGGETSIVGGSTSAGINYGIVGNHVVNYTGGLSFGEVSVRNEIRSPDIYWDLPGAADDDVEIAGAFIRWTGWTDLPLINGMFYNWRVRAAGPGENYDNSSFETGSRHGFGYYGGETARWVDYRQDVTNHLRLGPERLQVSLYVFDYASVFNFPGTAATPSPCFDNVAVYKYRLGGPTLATRSVDTAQDGFPVGGSIDASTPAARGGLDVPFNMARDINSGDQFNVPGDSAIVDILAVIPGTSLADIRMVWALNTNPLFEDALRVAPGRVKDENVVAGPAGTVWTGESLADTSKTSSGAIVADRFFVDVPDLDFMYPGDVLHYYIQAIDSDGRTTTLPADTSGFMDFTPTTAYDRAFTVRALPSISDTAGVTPSILVWNDFGRRGGEHLWTAAFGQLGYSEGVDFDTYTTQGPTSGVSNGLGSAGAHGANADQLAGYEHMFYFAGDLSTFLLSSGSNADNNDKSNDIGLMEQWHALPGTHNCAYFGDHIGTALVNDSAEGAAYVVNTMGVSYIDRDVRDAIGDQLYPIVTPSSYGATWFATDFLAIAGCPTINEFDQIQPLAGAHAGHYFTSADGTPITDMSAGVASVIHPTASGVDITFPYSTMFIQNVVTRDAGVSSRTQVIADVLGLFNASAGGVPVDVPEVQVAKLRTFPNPFNPVTVVSFTAPLGSKGFVKVFNLRGELVRTLHSGEFVRQEFRWDGVDDRGASVASGVYLVQAATDGTTQTTKVALVK